MNRRALVLGASSPGGLGEATARQLAADGFSVVVAGRRRDALDALAQTIGGEAATCDVTDEDQLSALFAMAGPLDVAVNAAGTTDAGSIAKLKRERLEAQMAIHITGNLMFLKHALPQLGSGSSVTLFSSLTAQVAGASLAAYGASKAALNHIVRIAALEFGPRGIRVNAVAPGFSKTPMTETLLADDHFRQAYAREAALGTLVTPEQVAATVAFLSTADCFITGEIIQVSGGAQLGRLPRADEIRR